MKAPDFEQRIGIDTYVSDHPGINGKLRVRIDDFHVTERFLYPPKKDQGNFTIAEVTCRNWETHTLVIELSRQLHISQRRIGFAGTKDKRALTTQLMSFDHISSEQLSRITLKGVSIGNMYQSNVPVHIGDLQGNHFEITIRNLSDDVESKQILSLTSPFQIWGGFPNFYGIQRFGVVRPITHLVGKDIIRGDFDHAAMTYLGNPMPGENILTYNLRAELERTRNFSTAFHSYPDTLNFEKALLNKLMVNPDNFIGAFKELPKNLLMMFVNAYESLIFNKILSERIHRHLPIHQAIIGDLIAPVRKEVISEESIPVTAANIEKVNRQIARKKAVVTGLLVGYKSRFAEGEMGEIEHMILEAEQIDPRDFIISEMPFLSSSGSRRPLLALLPSLEWTLHPDEYTTDHQALTLRFELQKGCYATSLLREIMKSTDAKNY